MQSDEQQGNIEKAIIEVSSKYVTENGMEISASVMLALAYKA
ncbi:MAG: hypothetical protein RM022_014215 [Nostoc sp. EfeVER01]|nr:MULTISPECIES: hypothetical protein [unclassified Nostoc]MDZ7945365.1 hypothetical protein [Nostoc sp. EfeVER01]MDZ7993424.1 hypothetical protein [Nostoc sp. EspVER01]